MNGDNFVAPTQSQSQVHVQAPAQAQLDGLDSNNNTGNGVVAESTAAQQPRGERGPRRERGDRAPRGERTERAPRTADAQDSGASAPGDFVNAAPLASLPDSDPNATDVRAPESSNGASEEQQPRERRSRDRYGRDRRERGERGPRDSGANAEGAAPVMMDADASAMPSTEAAPAQDESPRRSYFSAAAEAAPAVVSASAAPVTAPVLAAAVTPEATAPAPTVAPVAAPAPVAVAPAPVVPVIVAAPTPVTVASAPVTPNAPVAPAAITAPVVNGLPRVATFALPMAELQQVAASTGLQWVNSDTDKIAAVQAAIAAEPKPIRVPRERPVATVAEEGPLVLVETRRDLSNMTLPFEQPPAA